MEIDRAHLLVVSGCKVFGKVVNIVVGTMVPVDAELALADTIADPVEAHVNGFGAALFDCVIDDSFSHLVVSFDGSGILWVAELDESGADGGSILGIVEECPYFGFSGGCEDHLHDAAEDVDGTIQRWLCSSWDFVSEEVVAAGSGSGHGFG